MRKSEVGAEALSLGQYQQRKMAEGDFQNLDGMTGYWKDKKQQHYEALMQEWELLGHIGDGIMKVQKDLDNIHGRSTELDELDEKVQQGDRKLYELIKE